MRSFVITCFFAAISLPVLAQECDTATHGLSAPTDRYIDNKDGTVTDKGTGSVWMRCSLGQVWDGGSCTGDVLLFTWAELETLADEFNLDGYAGYDDWRLPNLPELASITERACTNPRANLEIFPETPNVAYWTTMNKPATELIYIMNFGEGGVDASEKSYRGPVRMLRGERWWFPPAIREMREAEKQGQ